MVGTVVKLGSRGSDTTATANEWVEGDRVMTIFDLTHLTGQSQKNTWLLDSFYHCRVY